MTQPTTQTIQQAREIEPGVLRTLSGETVHGVPVLAWMWEVELPDPPGPARTVAYHWSTPGSHVEVTRLVDAQALSVSASEREALEARVKELEAALKPFAEIVEKDIGPDENDDDFYQPMPLRYARAEPIKIVHLKDALAALNGAKP